MKGSEITYQSLRMAEDKAAEYDPEPPERAVCGADSERLLEQGYRFDLCAREAGHDGFCQFISL